MGKGWECGVFDRGDAAFSPFSHFNEILQRRRRNKVAEGQEIAFAKEFSHPGSADGLAMRRLPFYNDEIDAVAGQDITHGGIVLFCDRA